MAVLPGLLQKTAILDPDTTVLAYGCRFVDIKVSLLLRHLLE